MRLKFEMWRPMLTASIDTRHFSFLQYEYKFMCSIYIDHKLVYDLKVLI